MHIIPSKMGWLLEDGAAVVLGVTYYFSRRGGMWRYWLGPMRERWQNRKKRMGSGLRRARAGGVWAVVGWGARGVAPPLVLATVLWACLTSGGTVFGVGANQEPQDALTPEVGRETHDSEGEQEVEDLLGPLRDSEADGVAKRWCVESLLGRGGQAIHEALNEELVKGDEVTQQVIVEALARWPDDLPEIYIPTLEELLLSVEGGRVKGVARALGRFDDRGLARRLIETAKDRSADIGRRVTAVTALGQRRSKGTAKALIGLLDETQAEEVREAAFGALVDLTGINAHGRDAGLWRQWWEEHKDRPAERWWAELAGRFARRAEDLAGQRQGAVGRLVEVTRQLYRAAGQDERQTMLLGMLGDGFEAIRQLALDLSEQRLIDGDPIGAGLREGLRQRLADTSVAIRRGSAQLLLDLSDEQAAATAAQRLLTGVERDPEVIGVYLAIMARSPRPEVVDRALEWLEDSRLGGQAAGVVSAAAAVGMLDEEQWTKAVWSVRRQLAEGRVPDPKFVELLGRLGGNEDWDWIQQWIRSPDDNIKRAAAQVWADSDRSLVELAKLTGDPVIQPIAIEAARRRGYQLQTFLALVGHEPKEEQVQRAWQRALVAMAWRMEPAEVVLADQELQSRTARGELRRAVLTAAINRLSDRLGMGTTTASTQPARGRSEMSPTEVEELQGILIELLSRRGEANLEGGYPGNAVTDYDRIRDLGADRAVLEQAQMALLEALVASGQLDRAFELLEEVLDGQGAVDVSGGGGNGGENGLDLAVRPFLEATVRQIEQDRKEAATELLTRLRRAMGDRLDGSLRQELEDLEHRLGGKLKKEDAAASNAGAEATVAPAESPAPPATTQPVVEAGAGK